MLERVFKPIAADHGYPQAPDTRQRRPPRPDRPGTAPTSEAGLEMQQLEKWITKTYGVAIVQQRERCMGGNPATRARVEISAPSHKQLEAAGRRASLRRRGGTETLLALARPGAGRLPADRR